MIEEHSCKTCRFWKRSHNSTHHIGECRRYAPQGRFSGEYFHFPNTDQDQWCGEYKPVDDDVKEEE